jgi:hypothetical protein
MHIYIYIYIYIYVCVCVCQFASQTWRRSSIGHAGAESLNVGASKYQSPTDFHAVTGTNFIVFIYFNLHITKSNDKLTTEKLLIVLFACGNSNGQAVACATSQNLASSRPAEVSGFYQFT